MAILLLGLAQLAEASTLQYIGQVGSFSNPVSIVFNPNDGKAYANSSDNVARIDPDALTGAVIFPLTQSTLAVVAIDTVLNTLFVVDYGDARLNRIDLSTDSVLTPFALPCGPKAIASFPSAGLLYVACDYGATKYVHALDASTGAILGGVPGNADNIVVDQTTGAVFTSDLSSTDLQVIRGGPTSMTATPVALGNYARPGLAVNSATGRVYVAIPNNVHVVDETTDTIIDTIPTGMNPIALAVRDSVNRLYIALFNEQRVEMIDGATNTLIDQASTSGGPAAIAVSETGFVLTANDYEGTVTVLKEVPNGTISGDVTTDGGAEPVVGAFVQACPVSGSCRVVSTDSSGHYNAIVVAPETYRVTVFPPGGTTLIPASVGPFVVNDSDAIDADVSLEEPIAPPAGTGITNGQLQGGLTVVYWSQPLDLTASGCAGGAATYEMTLIDGTVVRSGSMTETTPGTYAATIAALVPNSGLSHVAITIVCSSTTDEIPFDVYIDPSGIVRTTLGAPLADAVVTLLRSDSVDGPFTPVPDGSGEMSPANRTNPDTTGADGLFGWDVVAGFYKVRASHGGCVAPGDPSQAFVESAVLTIPPPVTDLDLQLDCTIAQHPQETVKLVLHESGSGAKSLVWVAKVPGVVLPSVAPSGTGATLRLTSQFFGETASAALPAAGWTANAVGTLFKFKNASAPSGPSVVKVALIKSGKLLKVVAKDTLITLDEPFHGSIRVEFVTGTDYYCSECSAPIIDEMGKYKATACPAPPTCP